MKIIITTDVKEVEELNPPRMFTFTGKGRTYYILLDDNGNKVGFIYVNDKNIGGIYVKESERFKGYGRYLMENSHCDAQFWVRKDNIQINEFCEKVLGKGTYFERKGRVVYNGL